MSSERAAKLVEAGIWLKLSGDREGARKLFERALRLDPDNQKALELLSSDSSPAHSNESEWAMAIGSQATGALVPSLDGDWGRLATKPGPGLDESAFTEHEDDGPSEEVVFKETLAPLERVGVQTIVIGGDPGPEIAPPSTPPLFGLGLGEQSPAESLSVLPRPAFGKAGAGSITVTIGGEPESEPIRHSTPPLFVGKAMASPPAPYPGASEPMGPAWKWSNTESSKIMKSEMSPRSSPTVPSSDSAWEKRSSPDIRFESAVEPDLALELISSDLTPTEPSDAQKNEIKAVLRGARDRLELDDHSGAMELIVKAQDLAPDNPDVQAMRERSEKTLLNMFESKLGKLEVIPRVLLKDDEIIWLNLDHRAGFVLAQIDGTVSFSDLFSVSGMSRIDTARILAQLVEEGVISRG